MIGLEVEGVEDRAAALAPFTVAYVKEARQHPNADRLRVCIVDTGSEEVQVVCGAPNARTGMKGVFAAAGSYIPGTDIDPEARQRSAARPPTACWSPSARWASPTITRASSSCRRTRPSARPSPR